MKKIVTIVIAVILLFTMASCAAGPNGLAKQPDDSGKVAGFWNGLWHGIIAPITFIISLFSDKVHIYEVHNSGGWYNFGFLIGISGIFGGGAGGAAVKRRRKRWKSREEE